LQLPKKFLVVRVRAHVQYSSLQSKLEIKSGGDISDGAFYRTSAFTIGANGTKTGTKGKSFCNYFSATTPGKVLKNVHGRTFLSLADKRKWCIKPAAREVPEARRLPRISPARMRKSRRSCEFAKQTRVEKLYRDVQFFKQLPIIR